MSQVLTILKSKPSPLVLKLNMPNVDELFCGFEAGDFALIYGHKSVSYLTQLLCIRAQLSSQLGGLTSQVIFIDGANTFRLYQVARLAQQHKLNPKQALERIKIARAFTAYQLNTLIREKLKAATEKYQAKIVIISNITQAFTDKDISEDEAQQLFSRALSCLSNYAKNNLIVIATHLPHYSNPRNEKLHSLLCKEANVILSLRQTRTERKVILEKHPRQILGQAILPSYISTLGDFMEAA